jgi:ABC-type hemin transport system ATPase subunit
MKLASLYLDDIVVIPAGKKLGTDQPRADLREQSFHASEGWDIHRIGHAACRDHRRVRRYVRRAARASSEEG